MRRVLELLVAVAVIALLQLATPSMGAQSGSASSAKASPADAPALDYEFFKTKVQPIFLKKRATHARCYVCHEESNHSLNLVKLTPGNTTWTEEESRRNFETASQLVTPGDPLGSTLLHHPLAPEAGGDAFHSGGRQFETQNDPDWQTLAEWVRGGKAK